METIHDLLGYDGLKIIQSDEKFRFSIDSLVLADFVQIRKQTKRLVDIGCGNGPISLFLTLKTTLPIVGVEIQESLALQAQQSVGLNHCEDQVTIVHEDIRVISKQEAFYHQFDVVVANPPYFEYNEHSHVNKNEYLTIARHEVKLTLEELVQAAEQMLSDHGYFYCIHRCVRLEELIIRLHHAGFKAKKIRFIHSKASQASELVLVEAQKGGRGELIIEPPLVIYDHQNQYSSEVMSIFHFKCE